MRELVESYIESGDKTLLEFAVNPDQFRDDVIDIALQRGYDERANIRPVDSIDVELTDRDAMAAVVFDGVAVKSIQVNPNYIDSEEKRNYVIAHEVSHIYHHAMSSATGMAEHRKEFYEEVKEILNDHFGGWEQYQKHFEIDIIINSDVYKSLLVDNPILSSTKTIQELGSSYVSMLSYIQDHIDESIGNTDKFDELSGRASTRTNLDDLSDLTIDFRIGRGRGKSQLPIVEYDLEEDVLKVNESEYWVVPLRIDRDNNLEYESLDNDPEVALDQIDNAISFLRDLR